MYIHVRVGEESTSLSGCRHKTCCDGEYSRKDGVLITMITRSHAKIDGPAAALGKPLYVEDLAPEDALSVKILGSVHPFARIEWIDTSRALALEGVACILTHEDVPRVPVTFAAEAAPEGSTHDRTVLERTVRYMGEPVAVVAAESEKIALKALELIEVEYTVLEPNFDMETAIGSTPLYEKAEVFTHFDNGSRPEENLIAAKRQSHGEEVSQVLSESEHHVDIISRTQAQAHAMSETHRCFCTPDPRGKLVIYSSCQSVFNTQRIVAESLGIPAYKVRLIKPKVGGAFGGKNTTFFEPIVAAVTLKTGRSCKLITTRRECFTITNTRHASKVRVQMGLDTTGRISAISVDMLINGGAHGEHSFDVLCVGCFNSIPIYRTPRALSFDGRAVYTNTVPAGAFRGFGGPQVQFALEGAVSKLAWESGKDPSILRLENCITEGEKHPFVSGGVVKSSTLRQLIERGRELIDWEQHYPARRVDEDTIRAVGMSIAMHGSGIGGLDRVNATVSLNYDGSVTLFVGSCDLGTGADTVLLQIASQVLELDTEAINLVVSDTELTPYDKGAYASSTTYVTGNAVAAACRELRSRILEQAARLYELSSADDLELSEGILKDPKDASIAIPLHRLATDLAGHGGGTQLSVTSPYRCDVSPPPYVAGFVLLDLDTKTGRIYLKKYVAVVDCGTVINPALARIQVEGGCAQCMGWALYEDVIYDAKGNLKSDNLFTYRIPTSMDIPPMEVQFISSYEPTGPFGAKSMGEVVFHTPAAAIREALLHATGIFYPSLPFTPMKVLKGIEELYEQGGTLPC